MENGTNNVTLLGSFPSASERPRRAHAIPARKLVTMLVAFVLVATAGGVVASGFFVSMATAAGRVVGSPAERIVDEMAVDLYRAPLAQASTLYAANGDLLATFYAQNRIVVPLDQISDHMVNAVIAIEDERFFDHDGVDMRGIVRAFVNNMQGGSTQGASTITMQYVKNRLIDAAYHDDDPFGILDAQAESMGRKAREAWMALALEQEVSKEDILEGYLNIAQFGRNNIFGVEAAARFFFNTTAAQLTPVQAATIAGVTNAPAHFDPTANPELSQQRRNIVLRQMYLHGHISESEWIEARDAPVEETLNITPVPVGCQAAGGAAFFCDYVINEIRNSPEFGATEADRVALLHRGGLRITTTLDVDMQRAAVDEVTSRVPAGNTAGLEAAVVSVEPGTGMIRAMAQNVPFDPNRNPAPGTTAVNFSAGPTHGASRGFQTGSVFKTFVLADWLREGHTLNEHVNANVIQRPQSQFSASCASFGGAPWGPRNVEGRNTGSLSVTRAMYNSVNTAFAAMATQLDLCSVRDTAWDMGFRPTVQRGGAPLFNPTPDDIFITPAMVLGTENSTPLSMAAAHATLAANGTYCAPIAITSVVRPNGEEMAVPSANCVEEAIPANVAATTTYALQHVMTHGTARQNRLAGGRVSAGKTGTNQGSSQTWFVGYTPQLSTAVWVGQSQGERVNFNIRLEGRFIRTLFGSTVAAPLWQAFMNRALEGQENLAFSAPDPALVGTFRPADMEGEGYGDDGYYDQYVPAAPSAPSPQQPAPVQPAPPVPAPPAPTPPPAPAPTPPPAPVEPPEPENGPA
ncbi:MAG: penicillin-binding protein [Cellulomonadaceae bacterium]|jgi:membrane peptidoglycan carboxypeptidase|nr:penicillin-binding protein [Cellulomonadaceae bacterium]